MESVKEKVVEEPSHIEQLKLKMSEQWGFTKEQVYKILWINYHDNSFQLVSQMFLTSEMFRLLKSWSP